MMQAEGREGTGAEVSRELVIPTTGELVSRDDPFARAGTRSNDGSLTIMGCDPDPGVRFPQRSVRGPAPDELSAAHRGSIPDGGPSCRDRASQEIYRPRQHRPADSAGRA
jgi:hypothetical protein